MRRGLFPNTASSSDRTFGALARNDSVEASPAQTDCLRGRDVQIASSCSSLGNNPGVLVESLGDMERLSSQAHDGLTVELWTDFSRHTPRRREYIDTHCHDGAAILMPSLLCL